jgi:ribose transport system substrate-binding protein
VTGTWTERTTRGGLRALRRGAVIAVAASAVAGASGCGQSDEGASASGSGGKGGKVKIALIQSYSGNDWQNASANLIKAVAKTSPFKDDVEFTHHIAGTDPQKQTQLIGSEISAGVDAVVLYPISPTALNPIVKKACAQGVIVVSYDSWTEEPCSYNVHVDVQKLAAARAEWLVEYLGGKGKIAEILGVAGTAFDTIHQKAVDEVLKQHPDIELVGREEGQWAQPGAREAITKLISAHPDLDGFIAQVGCWGAVDKLLDMNKEPLPCAGNVSEGHLRMMLPKGKEPTAIGLPSFAGSETTFTGALAFQQAYNLVKGGDAAKKDRCHETIIDPITYETEQIHLGDDPTKLGNVYASEHEPPVHPGFLANFYSPLVGQGLKASLLGESDQISTPKPPEPTGGDDKVDGIAEQENACLVP